MSRGKAIQALRMTRQAVKPSQSSFTHTQLRHFQSSAGAYAMGDTAKVKFSAGADETSLTAALQGLLDSAGEGGRWTLISSGQGLERSFKFKNFAKTWDASKKTGFFMPQAITSVLSQLRWIIRNPKLCCMGEVVVEGLYSNPVPHGYLFFGFNAHREGCTRGRKQRGIIPHPYRYHRGQGLDRTSDVSVMTKAVSKEKPLLPTCSQRDPIIRRDFMTAVSLQCKLKNHHPEWSNEIGMKTQSSQHLPRLAAGAAAVSTGACSLATLRRMDRPQHTSLARHQLNIRQVYNTTYIRWTTHNPEGLSAKDVELAGLCDSLARDFGEVVVAVDSGDAAQSCSLRQVADRVVGDAGDCCTPKKTYLIPLEVVHTRHAAKELHFYVRKERSVVTRLAYEGPSRTNKCLRPT
ncbi:hypothetical protein CHU98_g7329 [Xylaria longipes]|nr:hypothetical protein CHU98_g7329 [Xylaria longipes]